jgi:hypothetical protein
LLSFDRKRDVVVVGAGSVAGLFLAAVVGEICPDAVYDIALCQWLVSGKAESPY